MGNRRKGCPLTDNVYNGVICKKIIVIQTCYLKNFSTWNVDSAFFFATYTAQCWRIFTIVSATSISQLSTSSARVAAHSLLRRSVNALVYCGNGKSSCILFMSQISMFWYLQVYHWDLSPMGGSECHHIIVRAIFVCN